MTRTPRLNDLQLILLSNAAARENGSLVPFPDKFANEQTRVGRAIDALIKRRFVEEAPVTNPKLAFRAQDDRLIGLFITDAGRAAIAMGDVSAERKASSPSSPAGDARRAPARAPTKAALVLGLLNRSEGATLDDLVAATGWLPHTTRAHLTGLRKKGHTIARSKRGSATCYTIAAEG